MARNKSARQIRRERRAATRAVAPSDQAHAESEFADTPRSGAPGEAAGSTIALSRGDAPAALGLALLAAVVYFPALLGGFVWDDVILTGDPVIHRWSGLWDIWFSPADIKNEPHYWPVTYTTFWLEHKLWGLAPLGYHAVNVLLHAANVVLLWRLLANLAVPGALAVAAVFAAHPLHVESVAWIIERKDVLSALFYLGAVLAWIRFTEAPHPGRYCLALGLFTLGLLSKSIVVTLPVALLLWHWWKKGEVTRLDALRLTPFFLVALCITAADLAFYTSQRSHSFGFSAAERVLIAARALWFYAGKLLWPADLAVIHPRWDIHAGDPLGWTYVVAAAGLAASLWHVRHRLGRGPFAGAAFFAVTLSPVLGFVDFGYMKYAFVADRFQYLAGIGVMAVLVGGAVRVAGRLPGVLRHAATGAFAVVLAVLGALTWQQSGVYRSELAFWSHVVSLNPQARNAHRKLGAALIDAGRVREGYAAALVAVERRPDDYRAHVTLGRALKGMQRFAEAEEHLARALALNLRSEAAWRTVADLRLMQGRFGEAAEWFGKAIALDASDADALAGLGAALLGMKRYEAALDAADRALELAPELPEASRLHFLAARALRALGRLDTAEQRLVRALELDPRNAAPLVDLSGLRFEQQRLDDADEYLRRALELASGDAPELHYVAEALRRQGRHEEAIESYRAAIALVPAFAIAHSGLGDALFRLERYEEAIESLERAIALNPPPDIATTSLVLMGRAAARLGRADEAAEHYERAVAISPRNPAALNRLASSRFGDKRYEEALVLYRTLLEVRPDSARTHSNVGATLYILGRAEEARRSFERALALDPTLEMARSGIERLTRNPRPGDP